jgi:methyltransferase-like protein
MMLYHTEEIPERTERVVEGLELISFLAESAPASQEGYASFLQAYVAMRKKQKGEEQDDVYSFLLHDDLSEVNTPFYFHEFAARSASYGLQYLADGDFTTMVPSKFPPDVVQRVGTMARNTIEFEQYLDFLNNRSFRKTLLCHEGVALNRRVQPTPELMSAFQIVSHARPLSETPDIQGRTVEQFQADGDATISSDHPVTKAAMLYLCLIAPQAMSFHDLLAQDARLLATTLLQGFSYNMRLVELRVHSPHFLTKLSERPRASAFARLQARGKSIVTNVRHERVSLDSLARYLLPHLDGTRTRAELLELLRTVVAEGRVALSKEGRVVKDVSEVEEMLVQEVDSTLAFLAHAALLVG